MSNFGHTAIKYGVTLITALSLLGCGSQSKETVCTANVVNSLHVTVMDTSASLNIDLSDLSVIAIDHEGQEYTLTAQSALPEVGFPTFVYTGPWEQEGTFIIHASHEEVRLGTAKDIVVTGDACHVTTEEVEIELYRSDMLCEDGYAEVNAVCETRQGCAYPLLEEHQVSGLIGGESSTECVNECTFSQIAPGVCETVNFP